MKTKSKIRGVITALITPFKDGAIDKKSFANLLRQQMDQGVEGFVINGTTAESPCLQWDEVRALYRVAKAETGGQVPLIVGTGLNSTARTCELTQEASKWHPDAVLVVVPYYNRPPQRGLLQHFQQVAHASSVPVLLYNVPSRTVASLDVATTVELSREKNIVGIKDASGDLGAVDQIRAAAGAEFLQLSGDDGSCVDYVARGGHGVISVSSHIIGAEMRQHMQNPTTAAEYRSKYAELMKWLYIEANPIPVKMAMHWMGVIDSPEMRLPLCSLDEKFHGEFKACLKKLGKLP